MCNTSRYIIRYFSTVASEEHVYDKYSIYNQNVTILQIALNFTREDNFSPKQKSVAMVQILKHIFMSSFCLVLSYRKGFRCNLVHQSWD